MSDRDRTHEERLHKTDLLSLSAVARVLGISRQGAWWRAEHDPTFPRPLFVLVAPPSRRRRAWRRGDIEAWKAARA